MKKTLRVLICLLSFMFMTQAAQAVNWETMNDDHFILHYTENKNFAKEILDQAEKNYKRIALELGYPRYSEFWTWDNRVDIYIYPTQKSYLESTGMPEWSHGMADYTNKTIASFIGSTEFVDSILPHEIAHLIFRDFVGFKGEVPLWLDEGVAQWAEKVKRQEMKNIIKKLYEQNKLLLVDDMMQLDIRLLKDLDKVYIRPTKTKNGEQGVLFLSTDQLVSTYYLQAVGLIGFLIERYGSMKFAQFCRELRDGKNLNNALKSAYPAQIDGVLDLDEKFRAYVAKQ